MTNLIATKKKEAVCVPSTDPILIGKDIMELLSSSMYIDPMSIYREYVQNAADAVDDVRRVTPNLEGRVTITIDTQNQNRSVRIRDNGAGVPQRHFLQRLTAFGASTKRGTQARGFRGVGRLAGIGYCQELIFRSRAAGEQRVSELHWDCRKLKGMLRSAEFNGTLENLVHETVTQGTTVDNTSNESFFEVEMQGIIRHRDDALMSPDAVERYLSQVAPIPFSPEFPFAAEIQAHLAERVSLGNLKIVINDGKPVYRAHRKTFDVRAGLSDTFTDIEFVELDGDGGPAAVGWLLHHGYHGAIPPRARIGGLRLRSGDIQVGDSAIVETVFAEPRFNSWCVGEFHVIDDRIVPNGRRDHFEQNAHLHNLLSQLGPHARALTHRARQGSLRRKYQREFGQHEAVAREKMTIVRQGSLSAADQERFIQIATKAVDLMEKILAKNMLDSDEQALALDKLEHLRAALKELRADEPVATFLGRLTPKKREMYQQVFALVYEFAPADAIAQTIVGRMLNRLKRQH